MRIPRAFPHSNSDPKSDRKSQKLGEDEKFGNLFDRLPDELILSVLSKLSSSADSPSDLVTVLLICKRLKRLGLDPSVLSKASKNSLAIRAQKWSSYSHRFLKRCADSGNLDALYILGMIQFYCLEMRKGGTSLMAHAALGSHEQALFSLAVIQFNGTGGDKTQKSTRAGFALCARAALLGHVDAIREIGYCLRDGYGVSRDVAEGHKLLTQAGACELIGFGYGSGPHPANRFLKEWFGCGSGDIRGCGYGECGRRESRRHEFRRCAVCRVACYCSRACQARDWRGAHKFVCRQVDVWELPEGDGGDLFIEGN